MDKPDQALRNALKEPVYIYDSAIGVFRYELPTVANQSGSIVFTKSKKGELYALRKVK